jgi:hypothetical protein
MSHLSKTCTVLLVAILTGTMFSLFSTHAYAQSSEHMTSDQSHIPTANIGDRQLALEFTTSPATALPGDQIDMNLSMIDKNTNKNTAHVTYTIIITREDGKQVFSELVHGHEGKVSIRFIKDSSVETYKVSANYDTLSASYISDFGSPIKVQGQIFTTAGNYKVAVEAIGIDFDNTFLPEPLKYNFVVPLVPKQTLQVNYNNTTFDVGAYSTLTINKAELKTESKQLILSSSPISSNDSGNSTGTHDGDFTLKLEIPKEMMSGPFSASLGSGVALDVKEGEPSSDKTATLVVSGKHQDLVQVGEKTTGSSSSSQSIVITATNVVPEFPIGFAGVIAAIGFAAIITYIRASTPKGI